MFLFLLCKYLSELVGFPSEGLPSGGWLEGSDEEDWESSDSLSTILSIKLPGIDDFASSSGCVISTNFLFGL